MHGAHHLPGQGRYGLNFPSQTLMVQEGYLNLLLSYQSIFLVSIRWVFAQSVKISNESGSCYQSSFLGLKIVDFPCLVMVVASATESMQYAHRRRLDLPMSALTISNEIF